jgi:hypothetical protein
MAHFYGAVIQNVHRVPFHDFTLNLHYFFCEFIQETLRLLIKFDIHLFFVSM